MVCFKKADKRIYMKVASLKSEQLVLLRDALNNLMLFVEERHNDGVPHFYRYLDFMKNNIETCIYTRDDQGDGLEYLVKILLRDWNEANDEYIGIPSYEFKEENQRELCVQYLGLLDEVERYFIPDME